MMTVLMRVMCWTALLTLLGACGYQLRGAVEPLPPQLHTLRLRADNLDYEFQSILQSSLKSAGADLVDDASIVLDVLHYRMDRRSISLDSRAKAAEYELKGEFAFRLLSRGGRELLPKQTVTSTRIYFLDETKITGKAEEERLLRKEIMQDLVRQLSRQLQRVDPDHLRADDDETAT